MTIQTDITSLFNNDLLNEGLAKDILVNGTTTIAAVFGYSEIIDGSDKARQRVRVTIPGEFTGTIQLNNEMVVDGKTYSIDKIEPANPGTPILAFFIEGQI